MLPVTFALPVYALLCFLSGALLTLSFPITAAPIPGKKLLKLIALIAAGILFYVVSRPQGPLAGQHDIMLTLLWVVMLIFGSGLSLILGVLLIPASQRKAYKTPAEQDGWFYNTLAVAALAFVLAMVV